MTEGRHDDLRAQVRVEKVLEIVSLLVSEVEGLAESGKKVCRSVFSFDLFCQSQQSSTPTLIPRGKPHLTQVVLDTLFQDVHDVQEFPTLVDDIIVTDCELFEVLVLLSDLLARISHCPTMCDAASHNAEKIRDTAFRQLSELIFEDGLGPDVSISVFRDQSVSMRTTEYNNCAFACLIGVSSRLMAKQSRLTMMGPMTRGSSLASAGDGEKMRG